MLRSNPGREGRTKLMVELLEGTSFLVVFALGVLAERRGLPTAMLAFAAVPLLLRLSAISLRPLERSAAGSVRS